MRYRILTLNDISPRGLERLPRERYEIGAQLERPHAVLVRGADMHELTLPDSVRAVACAGAAVENVPVAQYSRRGIAVFNAPGANANAVKELVLASLFLAARNICQAWRFAVSLEGDDRAIEAGVRAGRGEFAGFELAGRTLGVVGLGAVGVEVANAAEALGMRVLGYDPQITVQRAWQLSAGIEQALSLDDLFARSDIVTVHVPLNEQTRGLVGEHRVRLVQRGGVLLNFSRAGIVDDAAVVAALDAGRLHAYVCDFPSNLLKAHPRIITLPHLGALTGEAADNCAIMAADQLRDFLENGNISNSVNFPQAHLARLPGSTRLAVANRNVPNVVGQICTRLAGAGLNVAGLLNASRGDYAYTLLDLEGTCGEDLLAAVRAIHGVLSAYRV
jgi:D-3-phosphoglycerate dehydrogenase